MAIAGAEVVADLQDLSPGVVIKIEMRVVVKGHLIENFQSRAVCRTERRKAGEVGIDGEARVVREGRQGMCYRLAVDSPGLRDRAEIVAAIIVELDGARKSVNYGIDTAEGGVIDRDEVA